MGITTNARTLCALLFATAIVACAPDADEDDFDISADTMRADTMGMMPQSGTLADPQIVRVVMTVNTADSTTGAMAESKGTHDAVKAYGRRMVQDHGMANQQLRQLGQSGGASPQESDLSRQLQQEAQQTSQTLQGLSGAEFDRRYIEHEAQMHQRVLDLLDQQLLQGAQNPQLRQQLEALRTTVQSHLEQARQIQGQLGQGNRPAGNTPGTTTGN